MARRKQAEKFPSMVEARPDNAAPGEQIDGQGLLSTAEPALQSVRLRARHTHAGIACQAGDTIHVSAPEARWLIEHGIGRAANHPTE